MRVVFPDPEKMEAAGFGSIAFCPFLLTDKGTYPREMNRYIRERALVEWIPTLKSSGSSEEGWVRRIEFQTKASLETMARRLVDFSRWLELSKSDWRTLKYSDLLLKWQAGLLEGTCSASGRPLRVKTVNGRVQEATMFLCWAAERELRPQFVVPLIRGRANIQNNGDHAFSQKAKIVVHRVGVLPLRPSKLALPSPADVDKWLAQVELLKGPIKRLCCELIITTGMRIAEVVQWRVDTLPPHNRWELVDGKVSVNIKWGVKGGKTSPGSLEGTKDRDILVPLELANRIEHYRTWQRPRLIAKWVRHAKSKEERNVRARITKSDRMWLSENTFSPFSSNQLYQDWTRLPACPINWHPHKGREYFAVELLVGHTRSLLESQGANATPRMDWLVGTLGSQVRVLLTPLLGHVSEKTSSIYLKAVWARLASEVEHPAMSWRNFQDKER